MRRKSVSAVWRVNELISRLKNPSAVSDLRGWRKQKAEGKQVLFSPLAEEPHPLLLKCPMRGQYAVTIGVYRPKGRVPGTLHVESSDMAAPCVVTSHEGFSTFFLGVHSLKGADLIIHKANGGEAGISHIAFEKRDGAAPFYSKDSIRRAPIVWAICDQADFAVESASSDVQNFECMVRYHRELGFNVISWHMYLGCCEYPTRVGTTFPLINLNDKEHLRLLSEHRREPFVDVVWHEWVNKYDTMAEGVRMAHREGLKFFPCFRMNNEWGAKWCEAHASPEFLQAFWQPEFFKKHPEYWKQLKDGSRYGGGMEYSHPAVRKYRLAIIKEVMENYPEIDGLFLDLHRHPSMVGYPDRAVAAFKKQYGIDVRKAKPLKEEVTDPRWLKFRARYFTQFMRSVKKEKQRLGKKYPTVVRTEKTFLECLREGADLEVWFKEKLVDGLILENYRTADYETSLAPVISAAKEAGVRVLGAFADPSFVENKPWNTVRKIAERWLDEGASGVAFYESNALVCGPQLRNHLPQWVRSIE